MNKRDAIRLCKKKYRQFMKADDDTVYTLPQPLKFDINHCTHFCPLCEYVKTKTGRTPFLDHENSCNLCPLVVQFGYTCGQLHYRNWRVFARMYVFNLTGDR